MAALEFRRGVVLVNFFRTLLFTVLFYGFLAVCCVILLPCLVLPQRYLYRGAHLWGAASFWIYRLCLGTVCEFRNFDSLPDAPCIIACKHQSAWDTVALVSHVPMNAIVMKRSLIAIPIYGLYLLKLSALPLDRGAGVSALRKLIRLGRKRAASGHRIVIFPEGRRRLPGAEPDYKSGVAALYRGLGLPCVPMAVNSGLFWPRRSFVHRSGRIVVEALPVIPPGLSREVFMARLVGDIEAGTARLEAEGSR